VQISEFESALAKGLGRPLLYLKNHDARPYRAAVLHACTHDLRDDRQCEDGRAPYLFELIQMTREPDFYRENILSALLAPAEDEDVSQMLAIIRRFAQQGNAIARQAVYSAIIRDAAENDFSDADGLIHLDGIDGLLFVVARYLTAEPEEDDWKPAWWVELLEERNGKDAAKQELEQASFALPEFALWLNNVRQSCQERQEQRQNRPRQPRRDYAALQASIATGKISRVTLWRWGRDASEEELKQVAADLLTEQDRDRLRAYLHIFWKRAFPGDHHSLMELARSGEEKFAGAAMQALTHIQHPDVRAFAHELMQQPQWYGMAVEMLSQNYQGGDYRLIESLLEQKLDSHDYHSLGIGVRHFTDAHPTIEAERALLLLYENGPCSICRSGCVDRLVTLNMLPEWTREECRYDAYAAIRETVQ
jgi:hypothetical protein